MTILENLQAVTFKMGEENFLIDIMKIQEIIRIVKITTVPNAPSFVEGVINLRGHIVPIVDLRKKFVMPAYTGNENVRRIIIIEVGSVQVGCIVDSIREVLKVEEANFEETPKIVIGIHQKFIQGIVKQNEEINILLDVDNLLSSEEQQLLASN